MEERIRGRERVEGWRVDHFLEGEEKDYVWKNLSQLYNEFKNLHWVICRHCFSTDDVCPDLGRCLPQHCPLPHVPPPGGGVGGICKEGHRESGQEAEGKELPLNRFLYTNTHRHSPNYPTCLLCCVSLFIVFLDDFRAHHVCVLVAGEAWWAGLPHHSHHHQWVSSQQVCHHPTHIGRPPPGQQTPITSFVYVEQLTTIFIMYWTSYLNITLSPSHINSNSH